jgi:thiamine biosynthesis lipoprotein
MPKHSRSFDSLGTHWVIDSDAIPQKIDAVKDELHRIDAIWSRFRDDSLVALMAKQAGTYPLAASDQKLIQWYKTLYDHTDGMVTPLIGQTLSDAGYDKTYSLKQKRVLHKTLAWDQVIDLGISDMTIKQPDLLDVGAAGKGFAVDQASDYLKDTDYVIDAGGDIKVSGPSVRIGLEDPRDATQLLGVATVTNASICGSSISRRAWGNWHHIINPNLSQPVDTVIATWVIADTAMQADGIATALFFVEPKKLIDLLPFEYCIVLKNGVIHTGGGTSIELFRKGIT